MNELIAEVEALLDGEDDLICAMANTSAVIFYGLPRINWAGFYREKNGELVLGPFQGKPACVRIASGKGVCGTAMAEDRPILVPDVHEFPGHIACDSASNSEIVAPLHGKNGRFIGVLDIDSPELRRFSEDELQAIVKIASLFSKF